ncbi:hypothetical protein HAX54_034223, partial [Datura stramonium]|nr:hypothetical protein [Datura stramonium]
GLAKVNPDNLSTVAMTSTPIAMAISLQWKFHCCSSALLTSSLVQFDPEITSKWLAADEVKDGLSFEKMARELEDRSLDQK